VTKTSDRVTAKVVTIRLPRVWGFDRVPTLPRGAGAGIGDNF
jgi:hypothetical protein